jgi:hypothetical protein
MKLRRLLPTLFVFAFVIPVRGQVRSRSEVDSLLKAAIAALDHYQQIAPGIHCEEATKAEFRDACKIALEGLEERVQESKAEIARYRRRSSPRAVDLFDAYEVFRRVMAEAEDINYAPDIYGEPNKQVLAEAYNTFVKVTAWFGGVVRISIQDAEQMR